MILTEVIIPKVEKINQISQMVKSLPFLTEVHVRQSIIILACINFVSNNQAFYL